MRDLSQDRLGMVIFPRLILGGVYSACRPAAKSVGVDRCHAE
jgi:hypothetical protein